MRVSGITSTIIVVVVHESTLQRLIRTPPAPIYTCTAPLAQHIAQTEPHDRGSGRQQARCVCHSSYPQGHPSPPLPAAGLSFSVPPTRTHCQSLIDSFGSDAFASAPRYVIVRTNKTKTLVTQATQRTTAISIIGPISIKRHTKIAAIGDSRKIKQSASGTNCQRKPNIDPATRFATVSLWTSLRTNCLSCWDLGKQIRDANSSASCAHSFRRQADIGFL